MKRREALSGLLLLPASLRALAQGSSKLPRIALVESVSEPANMVEGGHAYWGALLGELKRLGHVEGKTVTVERWSARGDTAVHGDLARRIVESRPTLIVTRARSLTTSVGAATSSIPIVAVSTIPKNLWESLSRPGRNVTGIQTGADQQQIYRKQLEFARELTKAGGRVAYLVPPEIWESVTGAAAREAAKQAGLALQPVFVANPVNEATIRKAFDEIAGSRFDVLVLSPATEFFPYFATIAELAIAARMRTMGPNRVSTEAGLLVSYGSNLAELFRRAAHYVDRILKGANPGEIPIEYPNTIEMVVNLKTAQALGIKVPQSILQRADRAIE